MSQIQENNSSAYVKHQSFADFKTNSETEAQVLKAMEGFEQDIATQPKSYQKEIITKALTEIKQNNSELFQLHPNTIEELSRIDVNQWSDYFFYRYRYEMFPKRHEVDEYPPCIQVEPVSMCNYRCVFCYQTDPVLTNPKNGHMGTMSVDLFKKIVDEAEGKIQAITLASRGEPLIHKNIDQILAYMRGKFLASKMNTNASLLNEKKAHAILESELSTLVFSADSADEENYSKLRVKGDLTKVLKNVKMFYEIKEKHYPKSKMITRVSGVKVNDQQNINDMTSFWGDYVDQVAFVQYNPWENVYDSDLSSVKEPCSDLWRRMFIWWDGIMNPCDVDYRSDLKVANADSTSISDAWLGEGYSNLRKKHLSQARQQCQPCDRCQFT